MSFKILLSFSLTILILTASAQRAEDYANITNDGSWCWFSDPRAVYYNGDKEQTYTGYVNSEGDIMITSLNHKNGELQNNILYKNLQIDDHINPSILILPDGRLMVFFTKHGGNIYFTKSEQPEDITSFSSTDSLELGDMLCYTNPVILSEENNRIYVFYRGGYDWKPAYIASDDLGDSWSAPKTIISKKVNNKFNRPYTKVISDGKASIHFAFTDGHPRQENYNSIYYLKYNKGAFYDASGKKLGDTTTLPIVQSKVPKAYDGIKNNQRSWIWDIALNSDNYPVMVYTSLPEETMHFYNYTAWDGENWQNTRITNAGSAFPRFIRPKEMRDPEPHYSGGIILDHENPNIVYLSKPVNDRFEIQKWTTNDDGKTFTASSVTSNSLQDNVRPFVVRNSPESVIPRVLWMYLEDYKHYTDYHTAIKGNQQASVFSCDINKKDIGQVVAAVADWQIKHMYLVPHHNLCWTNGALYSGMMQWAKASNDPAYMKWLYNMGRKYTWQPYFRMYHADDIVVGQMYLDMYQEKQDERILAPTKARLDYILENPSSSTLLLDYNNYKTLERWSWCDALFMAPPVYAKMAKVTGNDKYLAFMDKEYKATYDLLYDKEEHLFYRDHRFFPDKKLEANGEKVFWGRGNGWVMGGLVSILQDLPDDSPYRPFYENLFKEMAAKAALCNDSTGFWHASLLDPESYPNPETSSSAFFTYALAYGINSGLLNKKEYMPTVTRAWEALVSAVFADGKLGWVQPVGEDPKNVTAEMTEIYGVGAFLLAGSEMMKLAK